MIDTLARHLAAVSEAQRLLRMVLANNPAFREFAANGSSPSGRNATPRALDTDRYFKAYCLLNDAIAVLTAEPNSLPPGAAIPTPSTPPLSERINEILPQAAPHHEPAPLPDLDFVRQKLRVVLNASPEAACAAPPPWSPPLDEARVAIIRHDRPASLPQS